MFSISILAACGGRATSSADANGAGSVSAQDVCGRVQWPMQGRCSTRQGRSDAPSIAAPHERWSIELPSPSGPIIGRDGTIYVSTPSSVVALGADGSKKWELSARLDEFGAAIDANDVLYLPTFNHFGETWLNALDPYGTTKHIRLTAPEPPTGAAMLGPDGMIYVSSRSALAGILPSVEDTWTATYPPDATGSAAPAVARDGTVYVALSGATNLMAFAPDGSEKWRFRVHDVDPRFDEAAVVAAPVVGDDGTIYIATGMHSDARHFSRQSISEVIAVTPTGALAWRRDFGATGAFVPTAPVIGKSGSIVVGNALGSVAQISSAGVIEWSVETRTSVVGSAAVASDGTIYLPTSAGVVALGSDGTTLWSHAVGEPERAISVAIASDGSLVVACSSGHVFSLGD
jgi:outer membrane protein assembly factor BamB